MNNAELKKIIDDHLHWINEDCEEWQDLRADLCGANLCGADLDRANLYRANLYRANLCGANLCGANLCRANLCGANLCGANLCGADLCGANLCGANLCGADLDHSCLPLWCGSLKANFDSRQLKQIAYHLVKAGLQSSNATDADREELNKLIDYANEFHRADECGEIRR